MAYKCWLSLVSWSSFLIIPFTSPSGYCLSLDNDLRARGLFGSAMKQRRGKGGQCRGPARTVRHSRRCFQTRSSPKEWDSQSNFILTFYHISRRFLLLGVNFLAPARGSGRLSHNTFRKRLGHRNGDMAVGSWRCSIVKSQSQRCGQGTDSICQLAHGVWGCPSGLSLPCTQGKTRKEDSANTWHYGGKGEGG